MKATRSAVMRSTLGCDPSREVRDSAVPDRQPASRQARTKNGFAPKICQACGRPMEWRKAWARDWESVRYCSEKCKRS
jgi:hypothetical protein